MVWAFDQKCPSPAAKLVLIKLADHADDEGRCWPSQSAIARDCGLSRQTVNEQIKALARLGMIRVEQRFNGQGQMANRYFLLCRQIRQGVSADPTGGVASDDTEPSIEEDSSVAKEATEAPAALSAHHEADLSAQLFSVGVQIMVKRGIPEQRARSMIGKGRKILRDDAKVLAILLSVERSSPVEPISYFQKAVDREADGYVAPFSTPGFA